MYSLSEKPDIVAITEAKLSNNTVTNIDMSGYKFYHVDSTAAGGAGIYVCNSLKVIERPDIKFSMDLVESCWVEIEPGYQKKNIIIGCIYRHPKASFKIFRYVAY